MKTLGHYRDYYDSKQADQGFITFDLQADLAPLFNWNVKVTQQVTLANKQSNLLLDLMPISHIGKPTIKSNIRPHLPTPQVLFLYLSAEYSTPTTSHNTAVIIFDDHFSFWVSSHLVAVLKTCDDSIFCGFE